MSPAGTNAAIARLLAQQAHAQATAGSPLFLFPISARRISFLPASCERFLIWSEASYEAGTGELGFVLFDPELDGSGLLYSAGLMPQVLHDLLVPKQQQIVQREIIAAIAPYLSLPDLLRDRDVIHWIDNISAISCLLHGFSSKPDSACLIDAFHLLNAPLRSSSMSSRVPTLLIVESRLAQWRSVGWRLRK